MTRVFCKCGTALYYNVVTDETVFCEWCGRRYGIDAATGELIPPLEEFNLDKRDPSKEK